MPVFGVVETIAPTKDPYKELSDPFVAWGFGGGSFSDSLLRSASLRGQSMDEFEEDEVFDDSSYAWVRRPQRGIQLKVTPAEERFATMSVVDSRDRKKLIINESFQTEADAIAPAAQYTRTSNFLLQSVNETRAEKAQVVQTFDNAYIFFYGEQPRTLTISGILLNTEDFAWRYEWWENYNRYFRGTALVRAGYRLRLRWDDVTVEGYVLTSSCSEQTEAPYHINLQFQLFLTSYSSDHQPTTFLPYTSQIIDPVDIPNITLQQTAAGKVRSLALSNYLRDNLTYGRAMAAVKSDRLSRIAGAGASVDNFYSKLKQFLMGRPVRVPTGFAGSEALAGLESVNFAAGTSLGTTAFAALTEASLPVARQFVADLRSKSSHSRKVDASAQGPTAYRYYRENFDEFPRGGFIYYNAQKLLQSNVDKEAAKIRQLSIEKGRDLVVAEEEAQYFENVSRATMINFGINPDWGHDVAAFGWGRVALGAFVMVGQSMLSEDVFSPRTFADAARLGENRVGQGVRLGGF